MANNQTLASSSANPNSNYIYDVFLNHRGPDVKKTFASHLYRRLLSSGFRVFLDQEEMQEGENITSQIEGAIATASVHVAIFSPRYAESKWCLDELLLMLKSGATIIPVFYHVNPSELRRTQVEGNCGKYAEALRQLEKKKRNEPMTVQKWRQALSSVADISGLELQECNGDEGELVDRVLHLVQKRVRKPLLEVATDQPWLKEKLQDFEWTVLSQHHSEEVKIVGIAGVGGVGKTTLAKLFFNGKRSEYDRSCFLFDVREAASRGSLTSLQSKLYEDLTGQAQIVNSIDEGIAMLKSHVPSSQVLVILDDVDSVEQLRALFSPLKDTLISCSLILVTSSDKALLKSCDMKNSSIYNLKGLNREDSRKLFCLNAFRQHNPVVGFEEAVSQFLDQCQGLPLSLKVIGALLYTAGQDLGYWRNQLQKISEVVPKDIRGRLKISVDSLDEQEREIFLDIACFFIGENREKAIKIWDASNWQGSIGFQTLENKYLVEVDDRNCIRMHSHLRELGRALAVKEPKVRLWSLTDNAFCNVSHQSSVRGINLQTSGISLENHLEIGNPFVLRGLQLLKVQGEWCESISNHLRLSNLLWLRWDFSSFNRISSHVSEGVLETVSFSHGFSASVSERVSFSHGFSESVSEIASSSRLGCSEVVSSVRPCRYFSLPSSIPIKNLRVLEIFGGESHLETLWGSGNEVPIQLRELNIDVAHLQLPRSIGMLKHLEKIELGCTIEALPEEFFLLRSLKHLRMRVSMKSLPNAIGNLSNLRHLNLTGSCDLETLPNSFGNLTNLQCLSLYGCSGLETLPHSFGSLTGLKHLYLKGCSQLILSAETLGNIRTLESLDLSDCHKVEVLPPQVTRQRSLEKLSLWNVNFKELPSDIGNLSKLEILRVSFQDSSMEMLPPSLGKLKSLKHLTLFGGIWKCLPDSVAELNRLTDLKIDCGRIEFLPASLKELKSLTILKVTRCPLREVPFGKVEDVEGEDASAQQSERRLLDSSIHKCMLLRLKQLDLHGTRIRELSFAEGVCPNLRQLDISDCLELEEVGTLPTTLILLDLNGCDVLKSITGFCGLAKLRELDMRNCKTVEELPGVEALKSLLHLRVSGCCSLKSIRGLTQATNLRTPSSEAPPSDLIELELFKDLKLWKEELHELQVEGFYPEKEQQVEAQYFKGRNERQWEVEDFRRGNEQQLQGKNEQQSRSFMGGNEPQEQSGNFMAGTEPQEQSANFMAGTEPQEQSANFMAGTESSQVREMIKFGILLFVVSSAMTEIAATSRKYARALDYSSPGSNNHDYKDALSKTILFFEGQRSGVLPPNQRLTWRKDSALTDGFDQNVDLVGGYYDAGDNIKFGFPMAFTTTMLAWSVLEFGDLMGEELENAKSAIRWATDYLLKATAQPGKIFVQVGDPNSDHNCWERPEDMDTSRTVYSIDADNPGSDVAGETAAAMAAASIVFQSSDFDYSERLLETATQLFEFADTYRGAYSDTQRIKSGACPFYCDFDGYQDELLWAAVWLHKASASESYLQYIDGNGKTLGADDDFDEFGWDNKHAGINVLLSMEYLTGNLLLESYKGHADGFICSLLPETSYPPHFQYTPGGLIYKSNASNMQSVTSISFLALAYAKYLSDASNAVWCGNIEATPERLRAVAKQQVDYILGNNPLNLSYMVGYGSSFPQRIHHRASSLPSMVDHPDFIACKNGSYYYNSNDPNPNLLIGAVVGGPDEYDQFPDYRPNFRESEPTTYINAPLVGALSFFSANPW